MPTYEHLCGNCKHEWDEVYGMTVDPPTVCPKCGTDGKVKRLISGGSGPGIMRKTTGEIKSNLAADTRAMKERAKTDENFLANLVGSTYHTNKLRKEDLEKELIKIGKSVPTTKSAGSKTRPKIKTKGKKKK